MPRLFQNFTGNLSHRTHGNPEEFISSHLEKVIAVSQRRRARRTPRATTGRKELLFIPSIRLDLCAKDSTIPFNRPENRRTCTITKENTSLPVSVVNVLRQYFRTNYQNVTRLAGQDHGIRQRQAIKKTGARSHNVHRRSVICTQLRLND